MAFSRQEYWSGLQFPPPGDLPDSEIKTLSVVLAYGFFTTESPGSPLTLFVNITFFFFLGQTGHFSKKEDVFSF